MKTVWKCDANPPEYKFKDGKPLKYDPLSSAGPCQIISTPVFWKNRVYVAIGEDPEHQEGLGNLTCIDATKTGDVSKNGIIWSYKGIKRSMSTVSIDPATSLTGAKVIDRLLAGDPSIAIMNFSDPQIVRVDVRILSDDEAETVARCLRDVLKAK